MSFKTDHASDAVINPNDVISMNLRLEHLRRLWEPHSLSPRLGVPVCSIVSHRLESKPKSI